MPYYGRHRRFDMDHIAVSKIECQELPVPCAWRDIRKVLVDSVGFKSRLQLAEGFVRNAIGKDKLEISRNCINDFQTRLGRITLDISITISTHADVKPYSRDLESEVRRELSACQ